MVIYKYKNDFDVYPCLRQFYKFYDTELDPYIHFTQILITYPIKWSPIIYIIKKKKKIERNECETAKRTDRTHFELSNGCFDILTSISFYQSLDMW